MLTLELVGSYLDAQNDSSIVVYRSPDGQTGWKPIPIEEVPMWLRKPEVIERLVNSNDTATNSADPGSGFYTMARVGDIRAAQRQAHLMPASNTKH